MKTVERRRTAAWWLTAVAAAAVAAAGCQCGPTDPGAPDGGGGDAGAPDAGPSDAGPPDAGPPDAGPPDAGPPDAGPPDAGPPDAGPPDAGPGDAGSSTYDGGIPHLAWARRVTGETTQVSAVVATADGGVYAAGSFFNSAQLGHGEANQTTLTSAGSSDVFLARYDAAGALLWARQIGGLGHDHAGALTVLSDGSVVVVGDFSGGATVALGQPSAVTLSASSTDAFIARFRPDGSVAWAKNPRGPYFEYAWGAATHTDDTIYVAGVIDDATTFGFGEANQTVLTPPPSPNGNYEVFLARYNADGTLRWARRAGGSDQDAAASVAVLPDGSAVVTGTFEGAATFGPGEGGQTVLQADGGSDVFLARFQATGNLSWVRRAGGPANDRASQVAVRPDGSAVSCGYVEGPTTFGIGEAGAVTPPFGGLVDDFVWQVTAGAAFQWVRSTSAASYEYGRGVVALPDGKLVAAGWAYTAVTVGAGEANQTVVPAGVHLKALTVQGALAWAKAVTGVGEVWDLHADGQGRLTLGGSFAGTAVVGSNEATSFSLSCPLPSYQCGVVVRYVP